MEAGEMMAVLQRLEQGIGKYLAASPQASSTSQPSWTPAAVRSTVFQWGEAIRYATSIHTYLQHTYMHTYIPTYLHTYIHTYINTYIHIYVHTYLHT